MTATVDPGVRHPWAPTGAPPPAARRGPVRSRPDAVLAALLLGAVGVLALWWHDTGPLSGLGDWLTNAGRVTGLLAGYGVICLIALMARIPALERGIGTDRLARWHASGGRYTVSLIVAHALLITWGYAVTAHTDVVRQTSILLFSYPDVAMASVAGLLFVAVGAISVRAARARMAYETWYYLHFYTYLATALAFSHQFAVGADFATNALARLAWSALYVAVAAAVLWYRVLTPIRQALRHRMRVVDVRTEGPGVVSVYIAGRHLDELAAEPGQFFRWRFLSRGLWWAANPYSLSAPPSPGLVRITVKNLGNHSGAVAGLASGTRVVAEGPSGAFTAGHRRQRRVLLLAAGVGITPVRALFETLPGTSDDVTLIYRASRPADLVLRRELDAVAARRGARICYLLGSRDELGYDPVNPATMRTLVPHLRECDVYVCGPAGLIEHAVTVLRAAGVPRAHIHSESFAL